MDAITHAELLNLVDAPGDHFVSIYLPTYTAGRDMVQNPIRFKHLLHKAAEVLFARGINSTKLRDFLAPAQDLLDRREFWISPNHGLAVLISRKHMRIWRLPFECEELAIVGKHFRVTPLIDWLQSETPYYLLAVSQHRVRLLWGTRYTLQEVWVPGMPESLEKALHYDPREGQFQFHSGQPQIIGKEGLVFTGQGGEIDQAKTEIGAYFRLVGTAVTRFLHLRTEPLVFAGVDYLFPIYRQRNHYAHLATTHISGNPDLLSPESLCQQAWPIVEQFGHERLDAEIANFHQALQHARASNRLEDILCAAHAGAVQTLFICPSVHSYGSFEPAQNRVRLADGAAHNSEDLVNQAACHVLKHRGDVVSVTSGNIPVGGFMAATFRYAFSPTVPTSQQPAAMGGHL